MKKLVTLSIACMALVFSSAFALAQDNGQNGAGDKGKVGQQLKQKREGLQQLLKSLNLTSEQTAKVKEIMKKSREDIKEAMKGEGEKKEKAEKVKAIRKETLEAIRGVLTDEQKTKFDEYVKKQEEKGPGKKGKKK